MLSSHKFSQQCQETIMLSSHKFFPQPRGRRLILCSNIVKNEFKTFSVRTNYTSYKRFGHMAVKLRDIKILEIFGNEFKTVYVRTNYSSYKRFGHMVVKLRDVIFVHERSNISISIRSFF